MNSGYHLKYHLWYVRLLIQGLLLGLAVLLGALLRRHIVDLSRARVGAKRSKLGLLRAAALIDGLDRKLLLVLNPTSS